MDIIDDSEIMQRLHDDDESALTIVLKQVVPGVWPLLFRKFGEALSNEDLEEVIALSLGKLWKNRKDFDLAKGDLSGWLYVIARNSALDVLRRKAPKSKTVVLVEPIDPAAATSEEEVQRVLKSVISKLSKREQEVLLPLFDDSDVTANELSESLSVSPGAIRQLRFRAMQKLKQGLASVGYTVRRSKTTHPDL